MASPRSTTPAIVSTPAPTAIAGPVRPPAAGVNWSDLLNRGLDLGAQAAASSLALREARAYAQLNPPLPQPIPNFGAGYAAQPSPTPPWLFPVLIGGAVLGALVFLFALLKK